MPALREFKRSSSWVIKSTECLQAYATAAEYANVMVNYSWLDDGANSHFMIGYEGSQGDGGDRGSWTMLYVCSGFLHYVFVTV